MRHAFTALQQPLCCPCSPAAPGLLGAGCSDSNSASTYGLQESLGPRSLVNGFTGGSVTWQCAGFAQNQDANALRFGTTYSFWFTADQAPTMGDARLELFKPGNPGSQTVQLQRPLDGPIAAANYCGSTPNSALSITGLWVSGLDLNARSLDLDVTSMPPGQFGFIVTSLTPDQVDMPGGSAGNLCVGGAIGRLVGGVVFQSGSGGAATVPVDLDAIPTPNGTTQVMAGETRYFQAWHRDLTVAGVASSNFSRGLSLSFP